MANMPHIVLDEPNVWNRLTDLATENSFSLPTGVTVEFQAIYKNKPVRFFIGTDAPATPNWGYNSRYDVPPLLTLETDLLNVWVLAPKRSSAFTINTLINTSTPTDPL